MPPWAMSLITAILTFLESYFGPPQPGPIAAPSSMEEHLKNAQYHLDRALKVPGKVPEVQAAEMKVEEPEEVVTSVEPDKI